MASASPWLWFKSNFHFHKDSSHIGFGSTLTHCQIMLPSQVLKPRAPSSGCVCVNDIPKSATWACTGLISGVSAMELRTASLFNSVFYTKLPRHSLIWKGMQLTPGLIPAALGPGTQTYLSRHQRRPEHMPVLSTFSLEQRGGTCPRPHRLRRDM